MDDDAASRFTREVCAILTADIRTSGAKTLSDVCKAASLSLTSLMGSDQNVRVRGAGASTGEFEIEIRGPSIEGRISVTLPDATPS